MTRATFKEVSDGRAGSLIPLLPQHVAGSAIPPYSGGFDER